MLIVHEGNRALTVLYFPFSEVTPFCTLFGAWFVNANVCAVASGGNMNGENRSGENITGVIILITTKRIKEHSRSLGLSACQPGRSSVC